MTPEISIFVYGGGPLEGHTGGPSENPFNLILISLFPPAAIMM